MTDNISYLQDEYNRRFKDAKAFKGGYLAEIKGQVIYERRLRGGQHELVPMSSLEEAVQEAWADTSNNEATPWRVFDLINTEANYDEITLLTYDELRDAVQEKSDDEDE